MSQTTESGREASEFGHRAAALIGQKLGARKISSRTNEFLWNGEFITIRTARIGNHQVGVLKGMLRRVKFVIAAFEIDSGGFELFSLPSENYELEMRDSLTNSAVGLVRKRIFIEKGGSVGQVRISI